MMQYKSRAIALVLLCATGLSAQTFPDHPRLLFSSDQVSDVQVRATTPGTLANWAYARLASSTSIGNPGSYPLGNWVYMRQVRRMQEVALRYVITGYSSYRENARTALLNACNNIPCYGGEAYHAGTYPAAIAITFDLLYDDLTQSQRNLVVAKLEQWVNTFKSSSTVVSSYGGYAGATDNYSFGWFTGVALALMAIEGDSSYPNLQGELEATLAKLQSGWKDAVSPDGSIDESYGYANYGTLYSVYCAIAAENCGLGDRLAGTNIERSAGWFSTSLMGLEFPWHGDSSPDHKGLRLDPIVYHLQTRRYLKGLAAGDQAEIQGACEDLWGLEQIRAIKPISDETCTFGFSPYVAALLFAPCAPLLDAPSGTAAPQPSRPRLRSRFFRDNLNEGSPTANKTHNYFGIGQGGHGLLHNALTDTDRDFSAFFLIRDEWMNHSHEDDGHIALSLDGVKIFKDVGHGAGPQSSDHNIVLVQGAAEFNGASTNYYQPPSPNGRFLGRREASLFSEAFDYLRGDHSNMWMMANASRSVIMIKDPTTPYLVLVDRVNKGGSADHIYEQIFHSGGTAYGSGTVQDPMRITAGGKTVRSVYLEPANVNVIGAGQSSYGNWSWHRNRVTAVGQDLSFVSIQGPTAPTAVAPLIGASPETHGGVASFALFDDKIMAASNQALDAETISDARFVFLRSQGGSVTAWSLAEGRQLIHQGDVYLDADRDLVISVKDGVVRATTTNASGSFNGTLFSSIPVTSIEVDGQALNFMQSGNRVFVGSSVPNMELSSDDRAYTFTDDEIFDGLASPNTVVMGGVMTSSTGWANLRLRGGGFFEPRPVAFALDVIAPGGSIGSLATLRLETSNGAKDLLGAVVRAPSATSLERTLTLQDAQLQTVATMTLPNSLDGQSVRLSLELDPATGTVSVRDPLGVEIGSASVGAITAPFLARASVQVGSAIDNITVFDSAEDGVTPQGLAFWVTSNGRAGLATHHPSLMTYVRANLIVNGQLIDQNLTLLWFSLGQLEEQAASSCLPLGASAPYTVREVVYESVAIATLPTLSLGILCESNQGDQLGSLSHQY